MNAILPILAVLSVGTSASPTLTTSSRPEFPTPSIIQVAQSRAEDVCTSEVRDRGLQVEDVVETNEHSGGVEVIMRVSRRGDDYTVGCDYSSSTRDVELYRIEDRYEDDRGGDRFSRDGRNDRGGDEVRDRQDAESIARDAVRDQLGISNADSDIVEINDVQRENRNWVVEGEANGAPFRVQIRASDGSVDDFELF
jgi:hypothetical protein